MDASYYPASSKAGLGGVFQDSNGNFSGGFTGYIFSISFARHGKLLALLLGVKAARNHHYVPSVVEIDCLVFVQTMQSDSQEFSELGFLLTDLRHEINAASAATLHHVQCSANKVAHLLAREAYVPALDFFFQCSSSSFGGSITLKL